MQKLLSMFLVSGVVSATAFPAFACGGGGGGGCSMSGGGGYYAYGGRALAGGKIAGRAPMLAQAAPRVAPQQTKAAALVDANKRIASPAVRTVAAKVKEADQRTAKSPIYTCPMHPQVQWTKPTDCPLCGMKLKLKQTMAEAKKRDRAADEHARMNMGEMSDTPGTDRDEMGGMDEMMMCPSCMMNMGGMKMNGGTAAPASPKAGGAMGAMAGMGC